MAVGHKDKSGKFHPHSKHKSVIHASDVNKKAIRVRMKNPDGLFNKRRSVQEWLNLLQNDNSELSQEQLQEIKKRVRYADAMFREAMNNSSGLSNSEKIALKRRLLESALNKKPDTPEIKAIKNKIKYHSGKRVKTIIEGSPKKGFFRGNDKNKINYHWEKERKLHRELAELEGHKIRDDF